MSARQQATTRRTSLFFVSIKEYNEAAVSFKTLVSQSWSRFDKYFETIWIVSGEWVEKNRWEKSLLPLNV